MQQLTGSLEPYLELMDPDEDVLLNHLLPSIARDLGKLDELGTPGFEKLVCTLLREAKTFRTRGAS